MEKEVKIIDFLLKNGMKRTFLSNKLGTTRKTVYNWETGKTHPNIVDSEKIIDFLKSYFQDVYKIYSECNIYTKIE